MNYNLLYYFKVLGDMEHYGKAAKMLCIEQPTLSQSIKRLEAELGCCALFEKNGRNIRLTEQGQVFHRKISEGFDLLIAAEKEYLLSKKEMVIISSVHSRIGTDLAALISEFMQQDENQSIQIYISERHTPESFELLMNQQCDLIICSYQDPQYNLIYIPIASCPKVLYVPSNHPLARYDQIDIRDTLEYRFIYPCENTGMRHHVERLFREVNSSPTAILEAESINLMLSLVSNHMGIAVCPKQNVLFYDNLKEISLINRENTIYYYLAYAEKRPLSPATKKLRDYIKKNIGFHF